MKYLLAFLCVLNCYTSFSQNIDTIPTHNNTNTYYETAVNYMKSENYKLAEQQLFLAINHSPDSLNISKYYHALSLINLQQKQPEDCKKHALLALDYNPKFGEAYITIGKAYAAYGKDCECLKEPIEWALTYCAAVDKFEEAKRVDTSLIQEANELIELYSNYFPDCHPYWIDEWDNKKFKIECWIQEVTVIRCRKY
ncbi:MAG: hypothetical protein JEZ09_06535 [Salinivirgaceae bacterium]|nr:hypothetical protein [Salinivirgaceae bacterium]